MNFNRFSFQLLFVLFTIYGSVIVMNLLVAMMINHMNMDEAESLLQTHRVEEISDKIVLREAFCPSQYTESADNPSMIMPLNENGLPQNPMVQN